MCVAAGCRYCPADASCTSIKDDDNFPHQCLKQSEFVAPGESCDPKAIYQSRFDGNEETDEPFFK